MSTGRSPMNKLVLASYGIIALVELAVLFGIPVPPHMQLLILATLTVFLGAHTYVAVRGDGTNEKTMSHSDAAQMPVVAGIMLVGLYVIFKYVTQEYVNVALKLYFCLVGSFSFASSLQVLTQLVLSNKRSKPLFIIPAIWQVTETPTPVTPAAIGAFLLGTIICAWYGLTNHWLANNLMGIAFCIQAISLVPIGRYDVGALMLGGLFFYDIFMVFYSGSALSSLTGGESVMVAVAMKIDGPIKLLFPIPADQVAPGGRNHSLLGLGDIAIPGMFIAFLLQFDAERALQNGKRNTLQQKEKSTNIKKGKKKDDDDDEEDDEDAALSITGNFSKPYFNASLFAYMLGLILTVVVMYSFESAQPALLYLVPAVLLMSFGQAIIRGEVTPLLAYRTENEVETVNNAKKEKEEAAATATSKKSD
jgi:minor histocompatibility antigen H13